MLYLADKQVTSPNWLRSLIVDMPEIMGSMSQYLALINTRIHALLCKRMQKASTKKKILFYICIYVSKQITINHIF